MGFGSQMYQKVWGSGLKGMGFGSQGSDGKTGLQNDVKNLTIRIVANEL